MKTAVFDARQILSKPSGIGVYAEQLLHRIPALLPNWSFVVLFCDKAKQAQFDTQLSPQLRCRVRSHLVEYSPMGLKNQLLLPTLLRRLGADLYHAPDYMIPFAAFPVRKEGAIRCIATIHDLIPLVVRDYAPGSRTSRMKRLYRACMRQTALRADVLVTISDTSRRDIVQALALNETDAARIHMAYNGVDDAFTPCEKPAKTSNEERTLLYVGRRDPYKNIPLLITAFSMALKRLPFPARLVIAGNKDDRYPEPELTANTLGIADKVLFTGSIPFNELVALYQTSDLLVHPSRYEGFGLQIVEAMKSGLPVLCTDGGSAPEIAGNAAVISPLELGESSIADKIVELLTDESRLSHLRNLGLQRAQIFSWNHTAAQIAKIY